MSSLDFAYTHARGIGPVAASETEHQAQAVPEDPLKRIDDLADSVEKARLQRMGTLKLIARCFPERSGQERM